MDGYQVYTVSSANFGDRQLVQPSGSPWGRAKNGSAGTFQTKFKVSDPNIAAIVAAGALDAISRWLVIEYEGVVVYAGLIWERTYDRDAKTLTVTHEDIWSVLDLRLIAENRTSSIVGWKRTYSGLEYDTIVKRLVQLGTAGVGREMPIRYEDDYAGGRSRTYYGYNLDTVLDAITEIMDLVDGPDIDFRPEWSADKTLQWTLRTGDLSLNTIEVDFSAEDSAVKNLTQTQSGRERATQMLGVGEGSGVDMLVRSAGGGGSFVLERAEQAKNIKTGAQLQEFAAAELAPRASLIHQYGFDLDLRSPRVGNMWEIRPGTIVRWNLNGDLVIRPDGWRISKILKYSGDTASRWLHLEFQ